MPHLVILYTANLDARPEASPGGDPPATRTARADMSGLCRALADTMLGLMDDAGAPVFPTGGVRVLAYPAAHSAVADAGEAGRAAGGTGDYAFAYLNLRMARGRSDAVKQRIGNALMATARACFEPLLGHRHVGVTFQIDEGHEVFDAKLSNLHPLFGKAP